MTGKTRHFTSGKFIAEPKMSITNRKTSFHVSEDPVKDKEIIKTIGINDEIKIKKTTIQKALSCDFRKSNTEAKKKEKTKKSISGGSGKLISKDTIREKKNKSWNHFQEISSNISSKTSLAQRVSEVLGRDRGKSMLEMNLSPKAIKKVDYKALLNNQTKLFNASTECSKKTCNNEQLPEKSLSFQHLQYPNRVMDVCKTISYVRSLKSDKNFSSLQQYKNNLTDQPETLTKPYQIRSSFWDQTEPPNHLSNLTGVCNGKVTSVLSGCNLGTKPTWRCRTQPHSSIIEKVSNQSNEELKNEISKSDKGSFRNYDPIKKCNNQSWQQTTAMKKNLKICQCPHFHTEEGIKKVCLQSSPDEQEYGQKFFRVNYIPKEEMDDSDEEKEYIDKGTTTEDETMKTSQKSLKNRNLRQTVSFKTKDSEIIKKDSQRNWKSKNSNNHDQKHTDLKEAPKYSTKFFKSMKEEQVKEQEEKTLNETAVNEVETLRKLFTKLKAAERLLKEENCSKTTKNIAGKNSRREKKKEMTGTDIQDEFKINSKELKAEIVRHVQNWLDAEFNSS